MPQENKERMELTVFGRVQGVGFRHYTVTQADKLDDVTGWEINEPDGSGFLIADAPSEELDRLKSAVEEGPRSARVEAIDEHRTQAKNEFSDFNVRFR